MRSITAPGALIAEATDCESAADMHHKLGIALKECRECQYWLELLIACRILDAEALNEVLRLLNEVTAMLVASRRTLKLRIK
jgi:four helix bundle protein